MESIVGGAAVLGRYLLEREVAIGGMGAVWLARDIESGARVAVKVIRELDALTRESRARFEREARAAARIRSRHVIATYEYGAEPDAAFIVMEYLDGEELTACLSREGRLTPSQSSAVFEQLCKGIDAIHVAAVVHRDIKPGNIFLAKTNDGEIVKILDFGVAKTASTQLGCLTSIGMMLGTPKYMSPEQLQDPSAVDWRTDLWSAAVVLYRMLTGVYPFTARSMPEFVEYVCTSQFRRASEVAPELPPRIDAFFCRAFSVDPDARFQSGREMATELLSLARDSRPHRQLDARRLCAR